MLCLWRPAELFSVDWERETCQDGFYPKLMPLMTKNDLFYNASMAFDGQSTNVPMLFVTTLYDIKRILVINC
jgi:hypothetical protein